MKSLDGLRLAGQVAHQIHLYQALCEPKHGSRQLGAPFIDVLGMNRPPYVHSGPLVRWGGITCRDFLLLAMAQ